MIWEDLKPIKQRLIEYVENINWNNEDTRESRLCLLSEMSGRFNVNNEKLTALLRSQLYSGNTAGAVRVIRFLPNRRFNMLGKVLSLPVVVPVALVIWVVMLPVNFGRWILRNL